ncbi:hypothetical protein [Flavobacterium facile]|uniref:hypothetical protein n=1 Tax=Flavobacterium facile TaxID=2893174 RepID=UPI002E783A28|nr:hypothetical protein [Flavobacterium sp. T-12]
MKFKTNYLLYILCLVILLFNIYELTFAVWSLTALITLRTNFSKHFIYIISCYIAILVISFLSDLFFYDHAIFNKVRDITYLLKPIIGLVVGYNFAKKYAGNALIYIINCGVFLSIIHLIIILYSILAYKTLSVSEIRHIGGYFNDFEPYVFVLLLFSTKFNIVISKQKRFIYLIIIATSILSYFSRTNFIQLIILILAVKGFFNLNAKSIKVIGFTIVFTLVGYALIYNSNPKRKGTFTDEFLYKVKIIPIEAFKTKINQEDWKDFNDNFRSFENIKTVNQIFYGGTQAIISGKGIGSTVDIGRVMVNNDNTNVRYYPFLHNAFSTVLLKSGLLGIIIYLLSIYLIAKKTISNNIQVNNINKLLLGSGIFLIMSSWVFMGFYLKLDSKSILIGLLLGYREYLNNQSLNSK